MLPVGSEVIVCQPEKRKVDSSILSLTTTCGSVPSALTSANTYLALSCPWPWCDRGCPFVTVVRHPLSHVDRTPRPVAALMVFKSIGDSLPGNVTTWAFSGRARRGTRDHPVYISRVPFGALFAGWLPSICSVVSCRGVW
jgi:hypothetical protein